MTLWFICWPCLWAQHCHPMSSDPALAQVLQRLHMKASLEDSSGWVSGVLPRTLYALTLPPRPCSWAASESVSLSVFPLLGHLVEIPSVPSFPLLIFPSNWAGCDPEPASDQPKWTCVFLIFCVMKWQRTKEHLGCILECSMIKLRELVGFFSFSFFGSTGAWTQSLTLTRQALYNMCHSAS
jgi:hypothetical protein